MTAALSAGNTQVSVTADKRGFGVSKCESFILGAGAGNVFCFRDRSGRRKKRKLSLKLDRFDGKGDKIT